ncbi:MAG: hypothetical protein RL011_2248 [Pseudomonadota bacterium]|jgi:phytoene dehydrogenase-like protein
MPKLVVIGSGIGGLASAALFAREGYEVTVLEQHTDLIGGQARTISVDGFEFCMGPQYCWSFGPGDEGDLFLSHLGIKADAPFKLMESVGFETVFIGDRGQAALDAYEVPMGLERFEAAMCQWFPQDARGLREMFRDIAEIYGAVRYFQRRAYGRHGSRRGNLRLLCDPAVKLSTKAKLIRCKTRTLGQFFDGYGLGDKARRILYGNGPIFCENESDLSSLLFVMATGHFHRGAYIPERGFSSLFGAIKNALERDGGQIRLGKKVTSLEVKGDGIGRVICEDGDAFACDVILSDISPRLTNELLPAAYRRSFDYEPSHSLSAVCFTVDQKLSSAQLMRGRNFWWQDGIGEVKFKNVDVFAAPQSLFVTSPTANGFGGLAGDASSQSVVAFYPGNFEQERLLKDEGPNVVECFKSKVTANVAAIIDRNILAGFSEAVRSSHVVSTLDIHHQTLSEAGNVYAKRMDLANHRRRFVDDKRLSNLYNVSAFKHGPGIINGMRGAMDLAEDLLGLRIMPRPV